MRNIDFALGEYYHIFNRGVDKREIFSDRYDLERFLQSMEVFNSVEPIGSIYEHVRGDSVSKKQKLVNFICYCINPNHYHFLLEPLIDGGIEKFMHKLGLGYTMYFNEKYDRSGSLFQGKYKAVYVDSDEYLLYLSAYINLNDKIHKFGDSVSKFVKSSWQEYSEGNHGDKINNFCDKDIILEQFANKKEYVKFAAETVAFAKENKDLKNLLLE